jgi:uncharacterized protein
MHEPDNRLLEVEVAWATPNDEVIIALRLPRGATAFNAIERSGILQRVPAIDLTKNKIGVFGKLVAPDYVLHQYDRVEIYRPLIADPKEIRRLRASKPVQKSK